MAAATGAGRPPGRRVQSQPLPSTPPPPPPLTTRPGGPPAASPATSSVPSPAAVRRPSRGNPPPAAANRSGGLIAGMVRGAPVTGVVRSRFHGPQVLGAALAVAIVGAAVLAVLGGHRMLTWFDATELYAVVILLALLALGRMRGTVIGDMAYSGRAFLPRRRRSAANPTPGATPAPSRGRHRAPEHSTEVDRFRIEELTGTSHACAFFGEPDGGRIKDGDFVHATVGRRPRSGELRARQIVVLSSANGVPIAQITPARRGDYAMARRIDRVAYGLTAALALGLAVGAVLVR